jgi:phage portal protein BeeE
MLLGIPGDNTYANQKEARLALWEQTILPLLDLVLDGLNHWLLPRFGTDLRLRVDEDGISALHPRREMLWARINAATFLSEDEKRQAVGYDRRRDVN